MHDDACFCDSGGMSRVTTVQSVTRVTTVQSVTRVTTVQSVTRVTSVQSGGDPPVGGVWSETRTDVCAGARPMGATRALRGPLLSANWAPKRRTVPREPYAAEADGGSTTAVGWRGTPPAHRHTATRRSETEPPEADVPDPRRGHGTVRVIQKHTHDCKTMASKHWSLGHTLNAQISSGVGQDSTPPPTPIAPGGYSILNECQS